MSRDRQQLTRGRYVVFTGHPPPLQQIAGQRRTGTGFTQAVPGNDGPKLMALSFTLKGYSSGTAYRPRVGSGGRVRGVVTKGQ